MLDSEYLQCPECHKLVHDPTLELARVSKPCPMCGASGASRSIWPGIDALKLLEFVFEQNLDSPDGHRVGLLFLASAFEVMLADILSTLVKAHTSSNRLGEIVLDEWDTLTRAKKLFNRLSVKPLGQILDTAKDQQFLRDWDVLAKRRNLLAHGHYYYEGSLDGLVLHRLKQHAFHAFAKIHNHIEDQITPDSGINGTGAFRNS